MNGLGGKWMVQVVEIIDREIIDRREIIESERSKAQKVDSHGLKWTVQNDIKWTVHESGRSKKTKVDGPQKMKLNGPKKCVGGQRGLKVDGPEKCVGNKNMKVHGLRLRGWSKRGESGRY